jgi:hypothetical protein
VTIDSDQRWSSDDLATSRSFCIVLTLVDLKGKFTLEVCARWLDVGVAPRRP